MALQLYKQKKSGERLRLIDLVDSFSLLLRSTSLKKLYS